MLSDDERIFIANLHSRIKASYGEKAKIPALIYARKSSEDKSEASIESQLTECKKLVKELRVLNVVGIYSDEDETGTKDFNRPQYLEMIKRIESNEAKVVITYKLNRLSRDMGLSTQLEKLVKSKGGIILSVYQSYTLDASGMLKRRIDQVMDEQQPLNCAEDTMKTLIRKANQGYRVGGEAPYGYDSNKGILTINQNESAVVKFIFSSVLNGESYHEICTELKARGFKTRRGNSFCKNTLHDMLRNVIYKGTLLYNRVGGKKKKERVLIKEFEEVRKDGVLPWIIEPQQFDEVQKILDSRMSDSRPINSRGQYPLTGLLHCAKCGSPMHGITKTGKGGIKRRYYVCNQHDNGHNLCTSKPLNANQLEMTISHLLFQFSNKVVQDQKVMKRICKTLVEEQKSTRRILERSKHNLENELDNLLTSLGRVDPENTDLVNKSISKKRQQVMDYEKALDLVEDEIQKTEAKFKTIGTNGFIFTVNDIYNDKVLLKALANVFIKDIKYDSKGITVELSD